MVLFAGVATAQGGSVALAETLRADSAQVGVITPKPPEPAPEQGLALYLPFETDTGATTQDASGNSHAGTVINCAWTNVGRYTGGAISFNDPASFIMFPSVPDFPSWDTYSVSVWFKGDMYSSYPAIMDKSPLNGYGWTISLGYGAIVWDMSYRRLIFGSTGEYSDGAWHHVTVVRNGTNAYLWIDGELQVSRNDAIAVYSSSALHVGNSSSISYYYDLYLSLGHYYYNYYYGSFPPTSLPYAHWSGQIDEIRIYNRALSKTEIGHLYADGLLLIPPAPVAVGGDLTVSGDLTVTGRAVFGGGARCQQPSGLPQGNYTQKP